MATFREEAAAKLGPLLAPIPGANPAGADVSYDTDFERMKAEIDKLSSVDGLQPSWSHIKELGYSVLSGKSKDIRVASWMTIAKLRSDGWSGFAEALVAYDGIARTYWDSMYPDVKRARARINVFAWMVDLAAQYLQAADVSMADGDAVRACDELLNELDRFLAEKLGDTYTGPGVLRSLLREKVRAIPQPAAAPAVAPSVQGTDGTSAPATASASVAGPAAATSAGDAEQAIRANAQAIAEAAALLRAADPAGPWPYRLHRLATWIAVLEPPSAEAGVTRLPPPPEEERRQLVGLRDRESWLELLKVAEEATGNYLFWLDLHRFVALALDKLGPGFAPAREAVGREVAAFLSRVPAVLDFAFSDGTPFAEPGTKTWLADEAKRWGGAAGGSSAASAVASAEDDEVAKRLAEATQMVGEGKVADGLGVASALAARAPDARSRFRAQLAVARLAIEGSRADLARPMLERLVDDIQRHGLEEWEPALCASVYSSLLVSIRAVLGKGGGPPDLAGKEQFVFDKLCRLDPASAIKWSAA
jgi:type VI secretion system protein VasJ